ncbi:MAG TPA: hypothetical protein VF444_21870 [Pseudonocardiaceae bacterium]
MTNPVEDFRPPSHWDALRTVCHGCRTQDTITEMGDGGQYVSRKVLHPGDGTIRRVVAASNEQGELIVEEPCPVCGDSDTPGWVVGFVPPL